MSKPLVDRNEISIAILGRSPGNGHPYSWSAMFNGYDRELMTRECPYAAIPEYLNKQPPETLSMPGAKITHICCTGEGEFDAEHVARCSLIPNVVRQPEDVIGKVDAVIVATDLGYEHVERCRPFVEAGLPLFVDKPMVDNPADLRVFNDWLAAGKPILSSSSCRYIKEFMPYRISTHNLGALKYAGITMAKYWETYGIHALESIYPILGPGFVSCRNTGSKESNVLHFKHRCGADLNVYVGVGMGGSGLLTLVGTDGWAQAKSQDSFHAFKTQLDEFVRWLRTGVRPFPYAETEELMRMVIAGIQSRAAGGKEIMLDQVL
ncbi:MAG: Gfo/Idh/MocA family oxidoreductase [Kiritimatiellia bacterium]|nr:oxidoreductase [Lentisphaerota bacterium]